MADAAALTRGLDHAGTRELPATTRPTVLMRDLESLAVTSRLDYATPAKISRQRARDVRVRDLTATFITICGALMTAMGLFVLIMLSLGI